MTTAEREHRAEIIRERVRMLSGGVLRRDPEAQRMAPRPAALVRTWLAPATVKARRMPRGMATSAVLGMRGRFRPGQVPGVNLRTARQTCYRLLREGCLRWCKTAMPTDGDREYEVTAKGRRLQPPNDELSDSHAKTK